MMNYAHRFDLSTVLSTRTGHVLIVISVNIKPSEKITQEEEKSNTEEVRDDKTMQKTC